LNIPENISGMGTCQYQKTEKISDFQENATKVLKKRRKIGAFRLQNCD